jgi:hypothetical protein
MLYRHGDVLISRVPSLPRQPRPLAGVTLALGEVTGHSHRIAEPGAARMWEAGGSRFLEVTAQSATLVHEEHRAMSLPQGLYRVWMQREYAPDENHWVED